MVTGIIVLRLIKLSQSNNVEIYIAGKETAVSTTTHCILELSYNPKEFQCLQNEINEVLSGYDNRITYESLEEMKFLNLCFKETQRKYQGLLDYRIPNSKLSIKKSTPIIIAIHAMQHDSDLYENPDEFVYS